MERSERTCPTIETFDTLQIGKDGCNSANGLQISLLHVFCCSFQSAERTHRNHCRSDTSNCQESQDLRLRSTASIATQTDLVHSLQQTQSCRDEEHGRKDRPRRIKWSVLMTSLARLGN